MEVAQHKESPVPEPSLHSSLMVQIYEDSSISEGIPTAHCSRLTQTDDSLLEDLLQERPLHVCDVDDSGREFWYVDAEASELMMKEVAESWKKVGEETRRASMEILEENMNLYPRLESLEEENEKLKEKNAQLSDIVVKAEALRELLEGKMEVAQHKESPVPKPSLHSSLVVQIYEDSSISEGTPIAHCSRLTQTDDSLLEENDVDDNEFWYIDAETYKLMVKGVAETWKEVAEERRRILIEMMVENANLYSILESLKEENEKLKEENAHLSDIVKAEALRELLELYSRPESLAEEKEKLKEENVQLSDIAVKVEALRELMENIVAGTEAP